MAELRGFLVALLLFSFMVTGAYVFMSGVYEFYGVEVEGEYSDFYAYVNKTVVSSTSDTSYNVTGSLETSSGESGEGNQIGSGIFKAILLPFQAVGSTISIISRIGGLIGVPEWVIGIFSTIIILMVMYWIASAIRGKDL